MRVLCACAVLALSVQAGAQVSGTLDTAAVPGPKVTVTCPGSNFYRWFDERWTATKVGGGGSATGGNHDMVNTASKTMLVVVGWPSVAWADGTWTVAVEVNVDHNDGGGSGWVSAGSFSVSVTGGVASVATGGGGGGGGGEGGGGTGGPTMPDMGSALRGAGAGALGAFGGMFRELIVVLALIAFIYMGVVWLWEQAKLAGAFPGVNHCSDKPKRRRVTSSEYRASQARIEQYKAMRR